MYCYAGTCDTSFLHTNSCEDVTHFKLQVCMCYLCVYSILLLLTDSLFVCVQHLASSQRLLICVCIASCFFLATPSYCSSVKLVNIDVKKYQLCHIITVYSLRQTCYIQQYHTPTNALVYNVLKISLKSSALKCSYCSDMFRQHIACHPQGALMILAKITINMNILPYSCINLQ